MRATGVLATSLCAAMIAALLAPNVAIAGSSCGGGGGGGGGSNSGGGGGSSSGGGGSSSSSSPPACEQTTTTVGHAECRKFGEGWDRRYQPRIRLSLGLAHQSLSLANIKLEGESTHGDAKHSYHYDSTLTENSNLQSELFGGAFGFRALIRNAHAGIEMSVVGGSTDGSWQQGEQGLRMRSTSAIQAKLKAVAGYTARYGKWSVVGELQSGVSITGVSVETRLADCLKSSMTTHAKAVVEPRIGVQRWLSPWLTTDLAVGSDLMQERDVSLTLSLTAHSRSYDGLY